MAKTVKGSGQPERQPDEASWAAGIGWTTVHVWHGPTKSGIYGLATEEFLTQYNRVDISSPDNGATWILRASFGGEGDTPGGDQPVDEWELQGSGRQENLITHPNAQALGDAVLRDIKKKLDDPTADVTIPAGDATTLYQFLLRGQDSFERDTPILRHIITVNNPFTINVAMDQIDRVHGFNQLPAITNGGVATAVNNLEAAGPPYVMPDGYVWGWLKKFPTISGTAFGKAQINQEWFLYAWPVPFVYEAAAI